MAPEWNAYWESVCRKLGCRHEGFLTIFKELDKLENPIIIETGCVRREESWNSDGSSSRLFNEYAKHHNGIFFTVDLSKESTDCAKKLCDQAIVMTGDSVEFLKDLAKSDIKADLLYLDSFDLNVEDPFPSSMHHLKELIAALPMIKPETLIVVDDCFYNVAKLVSGKGALVAKYMDEHGAKPFLLDYQCGWTNLTTQEGVNHGSTDRKT